jgi:hypothetical protein
MRQGYLGRPVRTFSVLARLPVYRPIGRRPSAVRVDEAMRPTLSPDAPHRLSDMVYETIAASPGDSIEEHGGGLVLVREDGTSHAISLVAPRPLDVENAFNHAALGLEADLAALEELRRLQTIAETEPRSGRTTVPRREREEFDEGHELVVDRRAGSASSAAPRRGKAAGRENG